MAKTMICPFCKKEITKGIFKGDNELLEVGNANFINCCEDCFKERKQDAKATRELFETKLCNYKWRNRCKVKEEELASLFEAFRVERNALQKDRYTLPTEICGYFYLCDENGHFRWAERRFGFMGSDISTKDKIRALEKNLEGNGDVFTKDDISCIRYRLCEKQELGLFSRAYSVEIALNEMTTISAKPQYGKAVIVVKGLFGLKKKAKAQMEDYLEVFKGAIGSNLPIEEVKKFR